MPTPELVVALAVLLAFIAWQVVRLWRERGRRCPHCGTRARHPRDENDLWGRAYHCVQCGWWFGREEPTGK